MLITALDAGVLVRDGLIPCLRLEMDGLEWHCIGFMHGTGVWVILQTSAYNRIGNR